MKRNLLVLFILALHSQILAQASHEFISGTVIDESNNAPVPYASIALFRSDDSTLVTGSATDEQGKFKLQVQEGAYYLKINFLAYYEKIVPDLSIDNKGLHLGKIYLKSSELALEEVEVRAEKSQMQLQLDKRVFNVGKDLGNKGANAAEILDNVPSVSVDIDGNVSLRGSENVRILIDGKPSGLVGMSGTDALRLLQGDLIESVEVITNPSARYDAEGEVGIINIVLKKEKKAGVNGSFDLSAGYPHNYSASYNLNYRTKHVNLFSSYGVHYRRTPGSGFNNQFFDSGDTSFAYLSTSSREREGLGNTLRLGSEFYLNDFNTISISGMYRYSKGNNKTNLEYEDIDQGNTIIQTVTRTDEEAETKHNLETAVNYRKTFEEKGRLFTADFQWFQSEDEELSDFLEISNNSFQNGITQRSSNTEDEQNFLVQTDYIHPFREAGKFETGLKGTFRNIENIYSVEEYSNSDAWEILPQFDDHFNYQENIYAAYVMAGEKLNNFSWQAGLRAELSDILTELIDSRIRNKRTYLDFFPSAHLAYELKKGNTLQLSYSRRLSRPGFRWLLPFSGYSDSRNIRSGNPDLDPEYTNSFELGYLKYWEKGSILSNIYYRHRNGVFERIIVADSNGITYRFPVNLSTQNAVGLELNANYDIFTWWRINGNLNFYRAITNGEYEGESLHSDTYTRTARFNSQMTFFKKLDFQSSFFYRAPYDDTQGRTKALYMIDAGLSMDVFKRNGTITFSVRDLLNSRKWRKTTETETLYAESEFQWRARQFLLSFNYRLNQKKKSGSRSGGGGFDDEGF